MTSAATRITDVGKAVDDTSSASPGPADPASTGYCKVAGGKSRSEGWELEAAGSAAHCRAGPWAAARGSRAAPCPTVGEATSRQGGYAVVDAMVGYRINPRYAVQLNVNNLLDKVYYVKFAPTATYFTYGDPRNASLTLRASF
ncbi:TonB-dependent receptor domain-containing protein [Xylophilus sp.]|uniref:TonB-dependent receptor domain-containing protein n=1 Tax=Xylophilus sp. TaxID=2653893 RepID=UPI002D806258|nr:TonB-dependent receptor [Xylophilus sp.]